jgi:hypothetical protein
MEIFDSFLAQNGSVGFESFVPKARTILKLPGEAFGKSYAIALPLAGRGRIASPDAIRVRGQALLSTQSKNLGSQDRQPSDPMD